MLSYAALACVTVASAGDGWDNRIVATLSVPKLTERDYLTIERAADYKSEFVAGEMYAMSGGTPRHSYIGLSASSHLKQQTRGSNCKTFNSDLRIRAHSGDYFYPDAFVVCGPLQMHEGSKDVCINPMLILEVLSPSTAAYDKGLKFKLYRTIPTLKDYIMVHFDSVYVEHYTRQPDDSWALREYSGEAALVPLPNINCALSLAAIYEDAMDLPG